MSSRILIVEDEPQLVKILEYLLRDEGYDVIALYRGEEVLATIEAQKPMLVILDIMLPGIDGFEVCTDIRRMTTVPVIVLTARKDQEDVIRGLELGADDYLTKPFNNKELILRIRRVLARTSLPEPHQIGKEEGVILDSDSREVRVEGRSVELTPTEFNLLLCLMKNRNRVLSWESLLREVWGSDDWDGGRELIKVTVRRLRKKLEPDPAKPKYILTSWGVGYKIGGIGSP